MSDQRQYTEEVVSSSNLVPGVRDEISFKTPAGDTVSGAMVTAVEYFCHTWNVFVWYIFEGYDGRLHEMTGWVALEQVQ